MRVPWEQGSCHDIIDGQARAAASLHLDTHACGTHSYTSSGEVCGSIMAPAVSAHLMSTCLRLVSPQAPPFPPAGMVQEWADVRTWEQCNDPSLSQSCCRPLVKDDPPASPAADHPIKLLLPDPSPRRALSFRILLTSHREPISSNPDHCCPPTVTPCTVRESVIWVALALPLFSAGVLAPWLYSALVQVSGRLTSEISFLSALPLAH